MRLLVSNMPDYVILIENASWNEVALLWNDIAISVEYVYSLYGITVQFAWNDGGMAYVLRVCTVCFKIVRLTSLGFVASVLI